MDGQYFLSGDTGSLLVADFGEDGAADGAATTGIDFDVIGSPPPSHRTGFRQDGPRSLTIKSIAARSDSLVNQSHFYQNNY